MCPCEETCVHSPTRLTGDNPHTPHGGQQPRPGGQVQEPEAGGRARGGGGGRGGQQGVKTQEGVGVALQEVATTLCLQPLHFPCHKAIIEIINNIVIVKSI